jgi:hypothetical protein
LRAREFDLAELTELGQQRLKNRSLIAGVAVALVLLALIGFGKIPVTANVMSLFSWIGIAITCGTTAGVWAARRASRLPRTEGWPKDGRQPRSEERPS